MERVIFSLPGNEYLAEKIAKGLNAEAGSIKLRHFPDGETYLKVLCDVRNKDAIVVCTLHEPDNKFLPLAFLLSSLRELGAHSVRLVAPYLSYMRQDRQFEPGEAVTSRYFAALISALADELITIDPHLHRVRNMNEIYFISCRTLHASPLISEFIRNNIEQPLLIGPDSESSQWVSAIAKDAGAPFIVLSKKRSGDRAVDIALPEISQYKHCTPVIADDIVSTAATMIKTTALLLGRGMKAPVCIAVHPVFSGGAYEELKQAGAASVYSCNTISHASNAIDISALIINALSRE